MSDQITTAAEWLIYTDPETGAVVSIPFGEGVAQRLLGALQEMYTPARPEPAEGVIPGQNPAIPEPTEEQVANRQRLFDLLDGWLCVTGLDDRRGYLNSFTDAVLALLPQRVAPSRNALARAIAAERVEGVAYSGKAAKRADLRAAASVAALYASQPTVAEVRAQALEEVERIVRPNGRIDKMWSPTGEDVTETDPIAVANRVLHKHADAIAARARAERGEA